MNVAFSGLSRIEMSVSIREIYDRCVYAMGYSAIDLCYNDINGEFYDSKKQYFPLGVEEIIELLNAKTAKNSQNYVQTHIYRLRNKLNRLLGNEYIISYKDHAYQLLCIHK